MRAVAGWLIAGLAVATIPSCVDHLSSPPTTATVTQQPASAPAAAPPPASSPEPAPPTSALPPAGPHSSVADFDLPPGSTPVEGMTFGSTTLKGEAWHYPGSYQDAVAYLKRQLTTKNFVDSSGHSMKLCPDAFGDPGPTLVKNQLTAWQYSNGLIQVSIEVNDFSATGSDVGMNPPDGHRIDVTNKMADCQG